MKSRRLLLGAAALVALVVACAVVWCVRWRTAVIPDVTQPADLTVAARPGDGWPMNSITGMSFHVTGEIDGEAEVWFGNGSRRRVSRRVDLLFGGDWFEPTCDFHYRPDGVTKGEIVVRYQFR